MQRLNDAIENMLRETLARKDTVAPGWRDEIRTIVRDIVAAEREACAKLVESRAEQRVEFGALHRAANAIRARSNA